MQHERASQTIASPALLQREVDFARLAWLAGLRPDQRGASQLREVSIDFPLLSRDVSCVRVGGTVVTASVSCALVEPRPFRPTHGLLEFSARRLVTERDGAVRDASKRLAAALERCVRDGGVLDTAALCVLPGRRVWSVSVDVTVLNDEGGAAAAAVWAAVAALAHFRRPELTLRGGEAHVHPPHEREPVPLSVHHTPIPFAFAVTEPPRGPSGRPNSHSPDRKGEALRVVVDPTLAEAAAAAATLTVAINAEGQVCGVSKAEGCGVRLEDVAGCVETATALAPRVLQLMKEAMAQHEERRREALKGQFKWAQKRTGVGRVEAEATRTKTEA